MMFTCRCDMVWLLLAELDNNGTLKGLTTESLSPMTGSLETSWSWWPFQHIVQSNLFLSHAKEKYNFTLFDRGWFHWICVLHGCILYFFGSKRFAGLQMWTCQQSGPQSSSHGVIGVVMPKRFTDNRMGSNANPVSTMCTWNTWAVRKTWLFEY